MAVLVTGGTGYIGSHICVEILKNEKDVVIIDNLSNSKKEVVEQIQNITQKKVTFYPGDVRNVSLLNHILKNHKIESCIHLAGLKYPEESVKDPLNYYQINLTSTLYLLQALKNWRVKKFIFSSSASVYGEPESVPIFENAPIHCTSPYGQTKQMIEQILADLSNSDPDWDITILRYFNPIGTRKNLSYHPDDANLMANILQVASGKKDCLHIFGNDYNTPDGTAIRDYIHVIDLAKAHEKALNHKEKGVKIYNLGTGKGYSVAELIHTFEKVNHVKIPTKIYPRRPGDISVSYCNPQKAEKDLGWKAKKTIDTMCKDSWENFYQHSSQKII